jgi:hydroxyethylthiazole kinase-like sugar kinase family protein
MNDFIHIQDITGAAHVIFTRHITNLTIQNSTAKIHINSGGSPMTVHTKFTIKELLEIIVNQPQ